MKPGKPNPSLIDLFLSFFWIGLTAFGGPAMYIHIRKKIVEELDWMDGETFDAGLALCQVIPGAIVMQLSAYVGLKIKGVRGAVVCFIGFGLPAFLIMLILSVIYKNAKNISGVEAILSSLRVVIISIIAHAAYTFAKKNFHHGYDVLIAITGACLFFLKLHPALVLGIAAIMGVLLSKSENHFSGTGKVKTGWLFVIVLISTLLLLILLFLFRYPYFVLAATMLRVDLFSFGGGLAALPIMFHELVVVLNWFDQKTFLDGIVLGQATPGSIIIAATFFGYIHFGFWGSLLATISVFIPSFLLLMGIVPFFDRMRKHPQFAKVVNGILCSFVGLLVVITVHFAMDIHWSVLNVMMAVAAFIALMFKIDVIWIILAGILFSFLN